MGRRSGRGAPPRFFLEVPPEPTGPGGAGGRAAPRLLEDELLHARRVLRLAPGNRCLGLDGRGRAFPLEVVAAGRHELGLRPAGEPEHEPAPGEPGAPLPWIELAVAWPRRPRAEAMLARLVQLGAAAVTPLAARWSGPEDLPPEGDPRLARLAREACKQSGRLWLPELHPPATALELLLARPGAAVAVLDPDTGMSLEVWARSLTPSPDGGIGTRERPIVLAVGPEGGFTNEEREAFLLRGATAVRVAPHVLRIETAAEAAMAVVGCAWMR